MRKIIVLAGLLMGAALFTGTPAKAWVGCECVKLGQPSVCVPGVGECLERGGVCLLPCDYQGPKMMKKHKHHRHHVHKKKKM
jgi:hypothetical protein